MPNCPNYLARSVLGLVAVYNCLPQYVISSQNVKVFQKKLQQLVVYLAATGHEEWKMSLNRASLSRSVLPRITEEAVRDLGELLPPTRLRSQ